MHPIDLRSTLREINLSLENHSSWMGWTWGIIKGEACYPLHKIHAFLMDNLSLIESELDSSLKRELRILSRKVAQSPFQEFGWIFWHISIYGKGSSWTPAKLPKDILRVVVSFLPFYAMLRLSIAFVNKKLLCEWLNERKWDRLSSEELKIVEHVIQKYSEEILYLGLRTPLSNSLVFLRKLTRVNELALQSLNSSDLPSLVQFLPRLVRLELYDFFNPLEGTIANLVALRSLTFLSLTFSTLSKKDVEAIAKMETLTTLKLRACQIDSATSPLLSSLTNLRLLSLAENPMPKHQLEPVLPFLPKLEMLDLQDCRLRYLSASQLENVPHLTFLKIDQNPLDENSLKVLSTIQNLTELNVAGCKLCTFPSLAALQNLRVLNLSGNDLPDQEIKPLSQLNSLRILALSCDSLTGKGIKTVSLLPLTQLKVWRLAPAFIPYLRSTMQNTLIIQLVSQKDELAYRLHI